MLSLHDHAHVHQSDCNTIGVHKHADHDHSNQNQQPFDSIDCHYCFVFFHQHVDQIPTYQFQIPSFTTFEIDFGLGKPLAGPIIRKFFIKGLRAPPQGMLSKNA